MSSTRGNRWTGDAEKGNELISSKEIFQANAFLDKVLDVTLSGSATLLKTRALVTVATENFVFPSNMSNDTDDGRRIS